MKWQGVVLMAACAIANPVRAQSESRSLTAGDSANARRLAAVPNDTAAARFLARVRAATARYRDRDQAVLDGYRPIGGDFPGMGDHWIDVRTLFSGTFTPEQPPILEYVTIDGRPTLIGVAYALPLLAGEMPPTLPGNVAWHSHVGTVEDESDLLSQAMESHGSMHGARLAMIHVWAWLPNPGGTFHAENWALPFVRAGLAPPAVDPGAVAGRVVSLVSGGDAFYERVFLSVAGATGSDSVAVHRALATARISAAAWVARNRRADADHEVVDQLPRVWAVMWETLDASLGSGARARLLPLRNR